MAVDREAAVTAAFVSLASSLATGADVVDLLDTLTTTCARLLDVASAGLLLADTRGVLHVLAASSHATRALELFQSQRDEGPCRDAYVTGASVSVPDLAGEIERWPRFVPAALAAGFASVHAVPLRLQQTTLGALGLFGTRVGALNAADLGLGQALADVASVALVQNTTPADPSAVQRQLQTALTHRAQVERAKGVLAQVGNLDMTNAFAVLRAYARRRGQRLSEVADAVVTGTLAAAQVIAGAPTQLGRAAGARPDR